MLSLKLQFSKVHRMMLVGLSLTVCQAQATTTTLSGVNFDVVYDDTLLGLFGAPTLSGDTIFFTPVSFKAESLNGAGIVTANSTLNLRVLEKGNKNITSFNLVEAGDYRLVGADSVVGVGGQTRVLDVANPSILGVSSITTASDLTIKNTIFDSTTHNWTSSSVISVTDSKWANTNAFNYTIENLLTAYTEPAGTGPKLAFIEKKFAGSTISLVVSTVPEPETYAMMLAGLGLLGFAARRKNQA